MIEIPYLEEILRTTSNKWITEGVVSRYCDATDDKQILLPLSKINMDHLIQKNDPYIPKIQQLNMFEVAL